MKRFQLCINFLRHDEYVRVLQRLWSGTVVVYPDRASTDDAISSYIRDARIVLRSAPPKKLWAVWSIVDLYELDLIEQGSLKS